MQIETRSTLVQALRLAHGALDVQRLDVLPLLLQEGDQEVDRHLDVDKELLVGHADVPDGDTHAQDLLELVLDRGPDLRDLGLERVVVGDEGRELSGLVQSRSEQTGNHLDDRVGSEERAVLGSQLLDELLVLVQLLQVLHGHGIHAEGGGLLTVVDVSQHADGQGGTRAVRELDGPAETLVLLRVVVLETDLELNRLSKAPLLGLGTLEDGGDRTAERLSGNLGSHSDTI
mmetsp:Transcript_4006/g.11488  ORF Transcript_4006/g.11488 Transcript_4006/m.11488 type:complete len:231 (+) Transcript_4006:182-874(+)